VEVVTFRDVEAAVERVAGKVKRTPVVTNSWLDAGSGMHLFLKAENLQITGAFKYRGATNAISYLTDKQREAGVVTYSSGNHGQAVARAARAAGSMSTVLVPSDAPIEKVGAIEAEGARLVRYDRYQENRAELALELVVKESLVLIPPFDDVDVMAGQGTTAMELLDEVSELDALFVPVGGGGLLAGCAVVTCHLSSGTAIYGVEPEAGDDHLRSRRAGRRIDIGVPRTIADGQQINTPGELTWPVTNHLTTQFLTVSDDEIVDTMKLLLDQTSMMIEPSGASALAAALHRNLGLEGKRVGVILSGGNIGWPRFRQLTEGGASHAQVRF
jgi:threonine dehydratase